jgi:hypothetical protein
MHRAGPAGRCADLATADPLHRPWAPRDVGRPLEATSCLGRWDSSARTPRATTRKAKTAAPGVAWRASGPSYWRCVSLEPSSRWLQFTRPQNGLDSPLFISVHSRSGRYNPNVSEVAVAEHGTASARTSNWPLRELDRCLPYHDGLLHPAGVRQPQPSERRRPGDFRENQVRRNEAERS